MAGRRIACLRALAAALAMSLPAAAQQSFSAGQDIIAAPIVTLDQDRLFAETLYGKRLIGEFEEVSRSLADRNREITAQLTEEERALTERRASLPPAEFRKLADAFDAKVTRLREDQDNRIRDLQRQRELEQRAFNTRIGPILTEIVRESGAVAILDERAVILSADQIDITDRAIARINTLIGDAGNLEPVKDLPAPEAPAGATIDGDLPGEVTDPVGTEDP